MQKKWHYIPLPNKTEIEALQKMLHTSKASTILLCQRGLNTFAKAKAFFNPESSFLHDPMKMMDMPKSVKRIYNAIKKKESIRIYGDYDVDGITAVTLLYKAFKKIGGEVSYYIPDRYNEGYGLSSVGVKKAIKDKVNLLICVDCGTRAIDRVSQANDAGLDVIICDHHQPGDVLPAAYALLNPKRADCTYPFDQLSGCGIAFKLVSALAKKYPEYNLDLNSYLDLLALSIAADIVSINNENRILAYLGLQRINQFPSLGIAALKADNPSESPLTISDLVFSIAPALNAAGRMLHAHKAVDLLLEVNRESAYKKAAILKESNERRKIEDRALYSEALEMIDKYDKKSFVHVLYQPNWRKGLIGIGAARCLEKHYKPTILFTKQNENTLVGSARSILGYNIYKALSACHHLLIQYGGHAYAAGLALHIKNLVPFQKALEAHAADHITKEDIQPKEIIDLELDFTALKPPFLRLLERMAPFGPGNRTPLFAAHRLKATHYVIYKEQHLKLWLQQDSQAPTWEAIGFNMAEKCDIILRNKPFSILYKIRSHIYQGQKRYQLILKDLQSSNKILT